MADLEVLDWEADIAPIAWRLKAEQSCSIADSLSAVPETIDVAFLCSDGYWRRHAAPRA